MECTLFQKALLNEWDFILCSNKEPDLSNSNTDEVSFIEQGKNVEFWSKLISEKHRNTFQLNKEKYYKMLGRKNNLHQQIKTKIVDKIFIYSKCANSTQRTPINREKLQKEINQDIIPFYNPHLEKIWTKRDTFILMNRTFLLWLKTFYMNCFIRLRCR